MIQEIHPCTIVEGGKPCVFARADGTCVYAGGSCETITALCAGCKHIETNNRGMRFCTIFHRPSERWENGSRCMFAANLVQVLGLFPDRTGTRLSTRDPDPVKKPVEAVTQP